MTENTLMTVRYHLPKPIEMLPNGIQHHEVDSIESFKIRAGDLRYLVVGARPSCGCLAVHTVFCKWEAVTLDKNNRAIRRHEFDCKEDAVNAARYMGSAVRIATDEALKYEL